MEILGAVLVLLFIMAIGFFASTLAFLLVDLLFHRDLDK